MYTISILSLLFTIAFSVYAQSSLSAPIFSSNDDCSCGYYDIVNGNLFTESLIVYFNETDTLSDDIILQSYENRYEKSSSLDRIQLDIQDLRNLWVLRLPYPSRTNKKDYNSIFRQGSNPTNVNFLNSSLFTDDNDESWSLPSSGSRSSRQISSNSPHQNVSSTIGRGGENSSTANDPISSSSPSGRPFTSSLKLSVDPPNGDHLVTGGGIRTVRQDIKYGSARAHLRLSNQGVGATSLSMMFRYNDTESMEINIMNTNQNSTSWVTSLVHLEFSDPSLGTKFSTFAGKNISLYDYNEFRLDWTESEVNWCIGSALVRSISKKNDSVPSTPSPFFIKHWSTGNPYSMQGPPISISDANIGWIRLFFNSSLMNSTDHANFDAQCNLTVACSMDDTTRRGSSPFPSAASDPWEQRVARDTLRWLAIWFSLKVFKKEEDVQPIPEDDNSVMSPPSSPYTHYRGASLTPAPSYRTRIESYNSESSTLIASFNFSSASHSVSAGRGLSGIGSPEQIYSKVDPGWDTCGSTSGENSDNAISINELPSNQPHSWPNSPAASRFDFNLNEKSRRLSGLKNTTTMDKIP
ncbi:hypothetical protein SS1G_12320 [Sclerotinia sclerotiorum 1980 UF-70]|uniref:GH16 domain-containing protein n=2 Tax=Sclerotinia sclerotiorum (strain ATCC 18683 / 1980 / Ss-1) TaxID=665079 RepID=A0A1D9Q3R8_SCLS1|nr:hypothetical protein SS1G_12320 [Sclerotinia sclerotiorum 1980 UF-70]APA09509.1 hypothetical protein sscle_05g042790 [Sclerotinia sclerotiorum 1980 UF-70]EDN96114.1 hypothetical protein SS1G_12320 [Sclerotinia sclerotiorum 1980 UF-70]